MIKLSLQIFYLGILYIVTSALLLSLIGSLTSHSESIQYVAYKADKSELFERCREMLIDDTFLLSYMPQSAAFKKAKNTCRYELFPMVGEK